MTEDAETVVRQYLADVMGRTVSGRLAGLELLHC